MTGLVRACVAMYCTRTKVLNDVVQFWCREDVSQITHNIAKFIHVNISVMIPVIEVKYLLEFFFRIFTQIRSLTVALATQEK